MPEPQNFSFLTAKIGFNYAALTTFSKCQKNPQTRTKEGPNCSSKEAITPIAAKVVDGY